MTTLTESDLDQGRRYLEQTRTGVIGATKGLTEAQWNFRPAPGCWSIAEILEHVAIVQELVLGPVREQLANAPAGANPDAAEVDAVVMYRFQDRLQRFKGPETILPQGGSAPEDVLRRVIANYDRLVEALETTPELREHLAHAAPLKAASNGRFEYMDGYQWLLAAGAHADRHTGQILEVKADAGFPVS